MLYRIRAHECGLIEADFMDKIDQSIQYLYALGITNRAKIAKLLCDMNFAQRIPQAILLREISPDSLAGKISSILIDIYTDNDTTIDNIAARVDPLFDVLLARL